jgi:hypothetical protein
MATTITAEQALTLAREFRLASGRLTDYRFANYARLTAAQRKSLEDRELDLLNSGNSMITQAVGLVLADTENSLTAIKNSTAKARAAIGRIEKAKAVIDVATHLVRLATAILSGDPAKIARAAKATLDAATTA